MEEGERGYVKERWGSRKAGCAAGRVLRRYTYTLRVAGDLGKQLALPPVPDADLVVVLEAACHQELRF